MYGVVKETTRRCRRRHPSLLDGSQGPYKVQGERGLVLDEIRTTNMHTSNQHRDLCINPVRRRLANMVKSWPVVRARALAKQHLNRPAPQV